MAFVHTDDDQVCIGKADRGEEQGASTLLSVFENAGSDGCCDRMQGSESSRCRVEWS